MSGSVYFWGHKRYNTDIYLLERNNTLERKQLAPGVFITTLDASKFNRCRITIHLRFPARRESATDAAVLALVLERGYAACPDMTALSRRLAELYGADLGVDLSNAGTDRILSADICGIQDRLCPERGEPDGRLCRHCLRHDLRSLSGGRCL